MSLRLAISLFVLTASAVAAGEWSGVAAAAEVAAVADGGAPAATATADAAAAPAGDPFEAANDALAEGNRLFTNKDYEGALAAYRRAQALYPKSARQIELNVGKTEEARGDIEAAAQAWERFLAGPLGSAAAHRDEVDAKLRGLGEQLGTLRVESPKQGLALRVDGIGRGTTPFELRVWLRPGQHKVTLEEGHRVVLEQQIDVQPGASVRLTLSDDQLGGAGAGGKDRLAPKPPPPEPEPPQGVRLGGDPSPEKSAVWKRWWFWAAGAVVIGGAVAVYLATRCPAGSNTCKDVSLHQ